MALSVRQEALIELAAAFGNGFASAPNVIGTSKQIGVMAAQAAEAALDRILTGTSIEAVGEAVDGEGAE